MQSAITKLQSPMLPGFIKAFYVPYKDKKIGPYYVRCWKKNGKCHREYIKQEDLEKVRAACERNRQRRQSQIRANRELTTVCGNLNYLLRMIKRSIKGTLRPEDHNHLAILETQGTTAGGRPSLRGGFGCGMLSVSETPDERAKRDIGGGAHHIKSDRSEIRDPRSQIFIAPSATNIPATPNTATPQYRSTESAPKAQGPTPRAPRWLTPALTTTLLAQIPQTPPTYSQTSLQQEECFQPPKPRKVIKYMLGPRDAKEWRLVGRSQPDEKGIVHENYIAVDDDWSDTYGLPPEERQGEVPRRGDGGAYRPYPHDTPNAKPTFKRTINGQIVEIEDDYDKPYGLPTPPPYDGPSNAPLQSTSNQDEVELAGPDYHARHRRPIDLTTGEEVDD